MTFEYPFEDRWFDRDGLRYHYLDEPGDGPTLLMVHGNPTWSFYFRRLIAALRGAYRVVAVDHIGCGRSDKPPEDRYRYTLQSRVEDLERLVNHLDLRDVTLVVHDWGGMIGTAWAARNPERLKRLIAMNTAAFHLPSGKAFPPSLRLARLPGVGAALVRGLSAFSRGANRFCVTRHPLPPQVAAGYLEPYASWDDRVAVHRFVTDIPLDPQDPAYAVVSQTADALHRFQGLPVLLLWGMRDFVFDHHFLTEWERRFPDAEVHRFDDAGHYVLEDAWDELKPLIQDFLHRTDAAEAAR